MISNERSWPSGPKPYRQPYRPTARQQPRPFVQEDTLHARELQVERKQFFLTLKENVRGRFLRISEEAGDRRNTIIIPATGLKEFRELVESMVNAANEPPPKDQSL